MATVARSWPSPTSFSVRHRRELARYSYVTLVGLVAVIVYLLPLGYMCLTAFKTQLQIQDPHSVLLPSSPVTYSYQGKDYPLYKVPTAQGVKELALVEKYRDESNFIDPAQPGAGLINWKGAWRTLEPVYRFDPTTGNFPIAWNQVNLGLLFRNSFIIAFTGMIGTLISSILVAYAFARFRFRGRDVLFLVLMATIILPTQITLIPRYIFFRAIGWGGTWWPLILPHFFANAYNVFLLRQYFRGIPRDLDEAATIDGASPLRVLTDVIIPQSMSAITAVGLFHFFWSWNDFFEPLVFLQGQPHLYTIPIGLTEFNNIFNIQPGLAMSAAMMAMALPVIVFFLAQRVFMQGIVITGVEK
jgi:multiple sugar transport system permease protein